MRRLSYRLRIYYGWVIAAAVSGLAFGNAASATTILGIFMPPMIDEFGWSRTEISVATSIGAIIGASVAPFSGRIADIAGSRLILGAGGMAVAFSCFYLIFTQSLIGFCGALIVLRTADEGLIKVGTPPAIAKWFFRHRGQVIALVFFSGMVGMITLAPIVQFFISYFGWRSAWGMLGCLTIIVGVIPCVLFVRRQPEDMGISIDGVDSSSFDINHPDWQQDTNEEAVWPLKEVLHTQTFWMIMISLFLISTAGSGVILHLPSYLIEQGLTVRTSVMVIIIFSASGAVGTLVIGGFSEKISPRKMLGCTYGLASASLACLTFTDTNLEAYVFAISMGIAMMGVNTLSPIICANYYGRSSIGAIFGISRAFQVIGFAVGVLVAGLAYDWRDGYQQAFWAFAVIAIISIFLIAVAKPPSRSPLSS